MAIKTVKQIVELLHQTGHLEYPFGKQQTIGKSVDRLKLNDPEVERAVASYQDFFSEPLEVLAIQHHGRAASHDGRIGPATKAILNCLRCEHPDYGPQVAAAQGTGGWKGCHGVGNFHAATMYIDESGMPSFLRPVFDEVLKNTFASYAELGLRITRTTNKNGANLTSSFVSRSSGWIGLALIGPGRCESTLWQRYLATYRPSNVVREWTTLWKHETGHNVGLQHSRGGVMNPGILQGLPISWKGDPHWSTLARMYGGQPVPGSGPEDRYWVKMGYQDQVGDEVWFDLPVPIKRGAATLKL